MKSTCNMSKVIWFFRLLVVVLVLSTLTAPLPADAQGSVVSLSGVGTATVTHNALPGGEKSKPQLISARLFILLLAVWAVLVFRKRKCKK